MEHRYVTADGVRLHYVIAGDGPPVVLLHGFPDFWYSWRHQLPALAGAGFRTIALDLRGYNRSDRPRGVGAYRMRHLVGDVRAVLHPLAQGAAAVVGHDWGGLIGWHLAAAAPQDVSRLVVLNAPHPARFRELLRGTTQLLRSWYAGAVQVPWLPERVLAARDAALLRRALASAGATRNAFTADDLRRYAEAFNDADAFRGPLNYYRAAARALVRSLVSSRAARDVAGDVTVPTLLIWGERDPALDVRNTQDLERFVRDLRIVRVPAAKHWVHLDAPEVVNRELITFLRDSA